MSDDGRSGKVREYRQTLMGGYNRVLDLLILQREPDSSMVAVSLLGRYNASHCR